MKIRGQLAVAVGAGYLLRGWTAKLARSPEVAKLGETIRGELMTAAKAAAVTAVNTRIESLNSRLQSSGEDLAVGVGEVAGTRSGEIRDHHVGEPEEGKEEPRERIESAEGEQVREAGEVPDDEGEERAEETGETDESAETAQPEREKPSRRRPRTRRTRDTGTAKEIREWAVQQGYEISSRGRIPADIEQTFRDAH
ncbi:histone-like nucleoid-structuring protein Lsr2 [Rhodococcus sp. NPDC059968]|uniref:Lsr2 family DNA-binding protein n=1 Tax=Rhodococcus sp. NPDC059968 TaxID=3347017 RepID=UPI00366ACA71